MNERRNMFIAVGAKPVRIICYECLSVCKEYNLRRHFKTTHTNSDDTFQPGSAARSQRISGLILSYYEQRRRTLFRACSDQESNVSIVTSGMDIGQKDRERGLAPSLVAVAPQLRSVHCLIHQSLLCAKLSGDLKRDHGLCHGYYKLYPLYQLTAPSFPQVVDRSVS